MTDNRTTVLLRRLLDERGVEHYDGTESTLWLKDEHGYRASADELSSGRLSVHIWCDTPEQAIAATLGSEREKALEELVRDMYCELRKDTTFIDKNGNERELPWVAEYLRPIEQRIAMLGIKVIDDD